MAKKKKSGQAESKGDSSTRPANGSAPAGKGKKAAGEASTSALIICRNK